MKLRFQKANNASGASEDSTIVSGGISNSNSKKKLVFIVVLIFIVLLVGAAATYILMNNKNNTNDVTEGGNPNKELAISEAKGAIEQQKIENGTDKETATNTEGGVTASGLQAPDTMNYEASLETASNLAQAGASVEDVMAYYNRALSLGGNENYAVNLNVALYLKSTASKKDAVQYIDKAIVLLPSSGIDPGTFEEQKLYLEQLRNEVQQ